MRHFLAIVAMAATIAQVNPGAADDLVKMTIGQRGNWDTSITHHGEKAGILEEARPPA